MATKPQKESRLYRIEKDFALFLQGIVELRESQKKTEEQLRRTDEKLDRGGAACRPGSGDEGRVTCDERFALIFKLEF